MRSINAAEITSRLPGCGHHGVPEEQWDIEAAQHVANRESPRTTKLYRRDCDLTVCTVDAEMLRR
jgi:hypothetical protein